SLSCRASDHIHAQLEMVLALEKKGLTYLIEGDGVYFDTSKIDDYGKLINQDPDLAKQVLMAQREGERVDKVVGRKNPTDFALWKLERPGENRQMVWPSPWCERSFPGWHIECSAMALEHLGEQIDIHTGGIDHINIHHSNEIAQTEAVTGKKPFSRYWVHHNHLFVEGKKMSKSLNNFYTIDDVIERAFSPKALRLLFLMSHYRSEQNFTWDSLQAAQKAYLKLARFVLNLRTSKRNSELELSDFPGAMQLHQDFFTSVENDLKTNEALTIVWELMASDLDSDVLYRLIMEFDQVLGLGLAGLTEESLLKSLQKSLDKKIIDQDFAQNLGLKQEVLQLTDLPSLIQDLIKKRQQARRDQDFTEADQLREQLKEQGYELLDLEDEQLSIRKI
ncbi:MAG: class I tRNA ligase family protein, partial [Patescibacteria group bacterium]